MSHDVQHLSMTTITQNMEGFKVLQQPWGQQLLASSRLTHFFIAIMIIVWQGEVAECGNWFAQQQATSNAIFIIADDLMVETIWFCVGISITVL